MTLTNIIQRVTYPLFCNIYNGKGKIDDAYLNTLKIAGVVVFPILLGIGLISKPLVSVLLGSEWKFTSDILFLLCIAFMIYPIHAININILQVHGRSDSFFAFGNTKKDIDDNYSCHYDANKYKCNGDWFSFTLISFVVFKWII